MQTQDQNQNTQSQEEGNTDTAKQSNDEQQEASEPIPPAIAAGEPNPSSCPGLPNDGRPQPSKGR